MLETVFPHDFFHYGLLFARIGTIFLFLPTLGERFVNSRSRIMFSWAVVFLLAPVLTPKLPPVPHEGTESLLLLGREAFIGAFLGLMARGFFLTLEIMSTTIAFMISLSNAFAFNPQINPGSVIGSLLGMIVLVLIFATNLHHLMLKSVVESYTVFDPKLGLPLEGMTESFTQMVAHSFTLGIQLATPFIAAALMFYTGIGLVARLIPQIQIFFVALPLQLMLGLLMTAMALSAGMMFFLEHYATAIQHLGGE